MYQKRDENEAYHHMNILVRNMLIKHWVWGGGYITQGEYYTRLEMISLQKKLVWLAVAPQWFQRKPLQKGNGRVDTSRAKSTWLPGNLHFWHRISVTKFGNAQTSFMNWLQRITKTLKEPFTKLIRGQCSALHFPSNTPADWPFDLPWPFPLWLGHPRCCQSGWDIRGNPVLIPQAPLLWDASSPNIENKGCQTQPFLNNEWSICCRCTYDLRQYLYNTN